MPDLAAALLVLFLATATERFLVRGLAAFLTGVTAAGTLMVVVLSVPATRPLAEVMLRVLALDMAAVLVLLQFAALMEAI
jgi:hypothetical protein